MNLVEYEFSSDEEEYGKETEEEKDQNKKKLKDETKTSNIFFNEKREYLKEQKREKINDKNCNNKKYSEEKYDTHDIKSNKKKNIHEDKLNKKGYTYEAHQKKSWGENRDMMKTDTVTFNEQKTNVKKDIQEEKRKENSILPIRISRWDTAYIPKKEEKEKYNKSSTNENSTSKVERIHIKTEECSDKKAKTKQSKKRKIEQINEEHIEEKNVDILEERKEKTKISGDAFFDNNNLMDMDINETNFEDVFEQTPNEYSCSINKKVFELKRLYDMGLTINKNIAESNEYNNPCILDKIMKVFEIEQYASNYPIHIFNPEEFDSINLFNEKQRETVETIKKSKWSSQN